MVNKHVCPRCGAKDPARILIGMPMFDEELERAMKNGEIYLGGCCMDGNNPTYKCRSCGYSFGRPAGDPPQTDFEIVADMYELYEPSCKTLEEAAEVFGKDWDNQLFFEYGGKVYALTKEEGFYIQAPKIDFSDIAWRGYETIAGPFETFEEMTTAAVFDGKSLQDIAPSISNGFYARW